MKNLLSAILVCVGALAFGVSGRADTPPTSSVRFVVLDGQDQPLRDDFNRDHGAVRLLFLVDPRCPECLRGLADMGDDLLSKLPKTTHLKVYVVYEPVIGGSGKDIPGAADLLQTTVARHYWNPTGAFGSQVSAAFGLRHGDEPVYAWDVYMIYPPNAVWKDAAPPRPQLLMHQLPGLEGQYPHLDANKFADVVQKLLAEAQ